MPRHLGCPIPVRAVTSVLSPRRTPCLRIPARVRPVTSLRYLAMDRRSSSRQQRQTLHRPALPLARKRRPTSSVLLFTARWAHLTASPATTTCYRLNPTATL